MQQYEVTLQDSLVPAAILAIVDNSIAGIGLTVTLRDTLRTYPGSTHWHLKNGRLPGVLELTYWPNGNRLWFSVHHNRNAPWIDSMLPALYNHVTLSIEQREIISSSS